MSTFAGIGETEVYERGTYLTANGSYELELERILLKDTRKSGLGFIAEFRVLEATGEGGAAHPPGSKATWFQKMLDKDVALPAIKGFMIALMKVDMNDPEEKEEFNNSLEQTLEEVTEEVAGDHPLKGYRVHVDTYTKLTKKNVEFTVHNWGVSQLTSEERSAA